MAQLILNPVELPASARGGAVAVGNFDGVHRGHARLVETLVAKAHQVGGPSVVYTFDPPPAAILFPNRPISMPLTAIRRRAELLGYLGVDYLLAYPTDTSLLNLSAEEFFQEKIVGMLFAQAMVEGPNFRFGKDRGGDTNILGQMCAEAELDLTIVEPMLMGDVEQSQMISSTRIRKLLAEGHVQEANRLLTRPYRLEGTVASGAQRGKQLGFPTANLTDVPCLLPADGVYAGCVELAGTSYSAAVNIGGNPTFAEGLQKVEIHLIDFSGDLYGESIACDLLQHIRPVQRFESVDALVEQLEKDVAACRKTFERCQA